MEIFTGYLGRFHNISGTAAADMPTNSVVSYGPFIAVTHEPWKNGETYTAYMPEAVSVYGFELYATAESTADIGTTMYVTSAGKVTTTATDNTRIGVLWKSIAVGDTLAAIAVQNPLPALPIASASVAGVVKVDGTTITASDAGAISAVFPVASTTVAGVVKVDGTTITATDAGVISAVGG